jgi:hypothetical protein
MAAQPIKLAPRPPSVGQVKFTEVLHRGTVIGPRCVDLAVAKAEPDVFTRDDDFRKPFLVSLSVPDALVLRDGGDAFGPVARVFVGRAGTEIEPSVVHPVAIGMVHDHPLGRLHNLAVHVDSLTPLPAYGVPTVRMPGPPAEPFVVGGVHVGVHAVAQRDLLDVALGRGRLGAVVAAGLAIGDRPHQAGRVRVIGANRPAGKARWQARHPQAQVPPGIHARGTISIEHTFLPSCDIVDSPPTVAHRCTSRRSIEYDYVWSIGQ